MTTSQVVRLLVARPFLDRARDAALGGRFRDAEQHLERARGVAPASSEAMVLAARILLLEGRMAECRNALLEAQRLGHSEVPIESMLQWLSAFTAHRATERGVGKRAQGVPDTSHVMRAPKLDRLGSAADLYLSIGRLRKYLGENPSCTVGLARMAEALATKAQDFPGDRSVLDEAETLAVRAFRMSPSFSEALISLGLVYRARGARLDSERLMRHAVDADGDNWFAQYCLGLALVERGAFEQGAHMLSLAARMRPQFIPSYDPLHRALEMVGARESAQRVQEEGIAQARDRIHACANDLLARAHLAILLGRRGSSEASREAVRGMLESFPKSGTALAHSALAFAVIGDAEAACSCLVAAKGRGFDLRPWLSLADFDGLRHLGDFRIL
jgi:tetratricopeptide (TPR) repeat protein